MHALVQCLSVTPKTFPACRHIITSYRSSNIIIVTITSLSLLHHLTSATYNSCNSHYLPLQAPGGSQGSTEKEAAVQRMLQNMPSADFIAKTLGIEQSGVESLLLQGKSYLAQQLTQRGVQPGATLAPPGEEKQKPSLDV